MNQYDRASYQYWREKSFHSAHSLAQVVSVCYSTIIRHLHDSLGLKNFRLRWMPQDLARGCVVADLEFAATTTNLGSERA
jgi:hypothetical protein